MIGKIVSKIVQSLPTWEVTKYYGRVCIYQLKCLKYKVQTSEAWFNFKCKFMPGSLRKELECEEPMERKEKTECKEQRIRQQQCKETQNTSHSSYEDTYSDRSTDESCQQEFTSKSKNHGSKKFQGNENYSMHNDYVPKKQRKVKRAQ